MADDGGKTRPSGGVAKAIALAVVTAAIGYVFNVLHEQRQAALARIDTQIATLYGPLHAVSQANDISWDGFTQRYWPDQARKRGSYFSDRQPSVAQVVLWQRWMRYVFQPLNERAATLVVEHGDQAGMGAVPHVFLAFVAHTAAYRAIMATWPTGRSVNDVALDPAGREALIPYPGGFSQCVEARYRALVARRDAIAGTMFVWHVDDALPKCAGDP